MPPLPEPARQLLAKAEKRSRHDLLEDRTRVVKGSRRFVIGERYRPLSKALEAEARAAFERYASKLESVKVPGDRLEILDLAFRIAGTGSLGGLRVAVLTRGRGGDDGAWIFDMKEARPPSAAALLVEPPDLPPAKRVLTGMRACLEQPPRMASTTKLGKLGVLVRRLAPQEDKLDWARLEAKHFGSTTEYLGALLGRAHRRGALKIPSKPWSDRDQRELLDRAIVIAGVHEASYLAQCRS
jgi:uncharacterized protein (DUF2252 family)